MSVKPFGPYIVAFVDAIKSFKDPATLALHLETIFNLCQDKELSRILMETHLKESLYKLHHECAT